MRISRPRGARIAPIALAVEPRFKASVLYLGGLMSAPRRPEVDEVNFLPRVKIPATQHFLPRDEQITATLNWLDRYLGPVPKSPGLFLTSGLSNGYLKTR